MTLVLVAIALTLSSSNTSKGADLEIKSLTW